MYSAKNPSNPQFLYKLQREDEKYQIYKTESGSETRQEMDNEILKIRVCSQTCGSVTSHRRPKLRWEVKMRIDLDLGWN